MGVIDIARSDVETTTPDTSVADVVRKLHRKSVSGLVVVDDGEPLDLVTDRNLTMALLDDNLDAEATPVREFVDGETPTVPADAGIYETMETVSERGVRRVIVVEDGELAGILSISDVVVLLGMELQQVANAIRSSSPAYERDGVGYYRE
jgi:CBS domain-containing protein